MEVAIPVPPSMDFNFDSTCSSPYMTAPSSPNRFRNNFFFSAPTSPSRISSLYSELNNSPSISCSSSPVKIPFDWEETPGTPKSRQQQDQDFEFDFSGHIDKTSSVSADELFHGGQIKPLKPLKPPPGYDPTTSTASSPRTSPPKSKNRDFDPFQAAIEEMKAQELPRGRDRIARSSNSIRKGSRSLSPLRVADIIHNSTTTTAAAATAAAAETTQNGQSNSYAGSFLSAISFSKSKGYYRKWKLKDFLLFRSASEGRATTTIKDYAVLPKKQESMEDVKNSSFRSTDSSIGNSSRRSNKSAAVSAHELHYTVNRAVSEEMKRKTFLPYKQGLLGCLGFNPGMQDIARRVGSLPRG